MSKKSFILSSLVILCFTVNNASAFIKEINPKLLSFKNLNRELCVPSVKIDSCTIETAAPKKIWMPKRVFVSSKTFTGDLITEAKALNGNDYSDGINAAKSICQNLADKAHLGGRWRAILSDSQSDIVNKLKTNSRLYLVDKRTPINKGKLWDGSPDLYIDLDEFGKKYVPGNEAWTGTDVNGFRQSSLKYVHCEDWSSISGTGRTGLISSRRVKPYFNWISYGAGANCSEKRSLYCFEY